VGLLVFAGALAEAGAPGDVQGARLGVVPAVRTLPGGLGSPVDPVVWGRVVEAGSGRPVASATVYVQGPDGERRAGTFTNADGTFRLDRGLGADAVLHVERLGYEPLSRPLPAPDTLPPGGLELALVPRPIALSAVEVTGRSLCAISPDDAGQIHDLWEVGRIALRAADLSASEAMVLHRTRTWQQLESQDGTRVEDRRASEQTGAGPPFETLPPPVLARQGYVEVDAEGARIVRGPDAQVLLSDEFARDHCFQVVRAPPASTEEGGSPHSGELGLAFTPAPEDHMAMDERVRIGGTLWIDGTSGELLRVDFQFLRFHPERLMWVPWAGDSGGTVHYRALADGRWVVEAWTIRLLRGLALSDVWYEVAGGELLEVLGDGVIP
jgi:hypothetical protein